MKVECQIDPNCPEPFAVLHVCKMTPAVNQTISILEKEGTGDASLYGKKDGKTWFIQPDSIELVRTEGRELVCYDRLKNRYLLNRTLYELELILGKRFIRISKSAIVNIGQIHHVEASFNGTMELVMKSGIEDHISRSYRKSFKERLGLE